jgi:integrase
MPKIKVPLSNQEINNASPKNKPYKLYDNEGLQLLIRPSGKKVFQCRYNYHNKANTYTIGEYAERKTPGKIGLADARRIRDEVRAKAASGIDPNQEKRLRELQEKKRLDTSFEGIARQWHDRSVWSEGHAKRILSSLQRQVFPYIGNIQIDEIKPRDIALIIEELEKKGTLDTAKRVGQRCTQVFDYAIHLGLAENNPARGRTKFLLSKPVEHRPFLKESELPAFIHKLRNYNGRDYVRLGMQILLLTFVRPGELRSAPWSEFDLEEGIWLIPAERMKMRRDHDVPLSRQCLELLKQLHEITGNSEYLFPGAHKTHQPISDATFSKVLHRIGYKGKVVPHGFRHTASTILNNEEFNKDHIEKQLSHEPKEKVRSVYNKADYLDARKEMMQWWADHLDELAQQYDRPVS